LKPDVCRRVVGRLPSPRTQGRLCRLCWTTTRDGTTVQIARLLLREAKQITVVYLVRSSRAYARICSLTTGTFNRVVKDRSAVRLSGAHSVQANSSFGRTHVSLLFGRTHRKESDCPRNLTNILCGAKPCQPQHPTGFPDDFHIGNSQVGTVVRGAYSQRVSVKSDVIPNGAKGPVRNLLSLAAARAQYSAQQYGLPL
jgi:hypothetical protein